MNKKGKNILIVIAVIILVALTGFFLYRNMQQSDISKLEVYNYEEDSNYTKYTQMEGIEFSYPSNYKQVESSEQLTFSDPEVEGLLVNVVSENSQNLSLEDYIKASLQTVRTSLDVQGDIQEKYINLNGTKAAKIDYTTKQNNTDIKLTQVVIIKSGKAYILTISCSPNDSEKIQEKVDKMVKSFR